MEKDVVLIGEAMGLFSADESGKLDDASYFSKKVAGAEVNVSIGLSRLGMDVELITRLGQDYFGRYILKFLESEVIGAGTVMDDITARTAILAGSKFIVSPHFDPAISTICNRYTIPYLPGCGSVTEIANAMANGVEIAKVFPGGILGAGFIKDVHGPIPQVELMPSGGVNLENMATWVNNGAWGVGVGSALTKDVAEKGYQAVTETAKTFADRYKEIRSGN
ncbi:PfkB family carbohydrate kinase [Psychrobacillus psychrotolerans]|uniref:PfkB family carbohydrate kinase n=1 Tax=Psychrobacillus psychrotolerans TaxID=126156 RepID=UPI0033163295